MLDVISIIFWGLLLLMLIVFVHELGHFLTARMFGVRVKEFMLGLPGPSIGFTHKGTRYGVTCLPLGGYARIAGMEAGPENPNLARAVAWLAYFGSLSAEDAQRSSEKLGFDLEEALDVLDEWGTVIRSRDANGAYRYEMPAASAECDKGDGSVLSPFSEQHSDCETVIGKDDKTEPSPLSHSPLSPSAVVAANNTLQDYPQGAPRPLGDADAFISRERVQTYRSLVWWKRMVILAAGAGFNLLFAIIIFTSVMLVNGEYVTTTVVETVAADSPAASAGIQPGDKLLSVDDTSYDSWQDFTAAIASHAPGDKVTVGFEHEQEAKKAELTLAASGERAVIGVTSHQEHRAIPLTDALSTSVGFIGYVATAILQLFNPATFQDTISQSSSVVGVSVEARNAATAGFLPFIILTAALSISIGLMNILPIPPLDGGKMVVETIQRLTRREIPLRIINGVSIAGIALLMVLFVICTSQDVQRYFLGG